MAILSGCMVGPNYRRPCVPVPESFRFASIETKDSLNSMWWELFGDPILTCYVEEAVQNNKGVKIAAANIEGALGLLMQTRSALFPQIGYTGEGSRERQNLGPSNIFTDLIKNPNSLYEGVLTASWQIDLFGRIRRQTQAARANVCATLAEWKNVELALISSVAATYLQLRGFDAQLEIAKKTLDAYGQELKYFQTQFDYGQVSLMTVAQAETQYETAAAAIPQIELDILQTENALNVLLGRNPGPIVRGKNITEILLPSVPEALPSAVLQNRPDIQEAEQNLIAQNALIGAARALYFPEISLTGFYGTASTELENLFSGPARVWNYTGTITGPLFTFGAIKGQVRQAEAAKKAALFTYEDVIINAFAEVENALGARVYYEKQLEAQRKLVAASSTYTELAKLQYHGGYAPYFVVLQAEEKQFPAELQLVQTDVLLLVSLVNLYQALGW